VVCGAGDWRRRSKWHITPSLPQHHKSKITRRAVVFGWNNAGRRKRQRAGAASIAVNNHASALAPRTFSLLFLFFSRIVRSEKKITAQARHIVKRVIHALTAQK